MDIFESDLAMARCHIAEAERVLTRQRALVAALTGLGRDTEAAHKTLAVFEEVLDAMQQHLAVEEWLAQEPGWSRLTVQRLALG